MTAVPAKFVTTRELSILHSHNLLSRWMWSCFVCVFVCFVLSVYLWHVLCLHCFYHTSCTVMTISRCTHPFLVWAEHWGAGFSPNFAQSRKQSTVIEEDIQSKCATLRICRWFWVVHCASFVAVYCMTSRFQIRKPGSSWQDRRLSLGVFVWILQTLFFFQTFPHWWSQVAEQYPTWPNTQSFLQMIRQEVTPDRANFSLPGSCHGCEIGFRDVVEMWNGWIEM